jgi:hypothetical protein
VLFRSAGADAADRATALFCFFPGSFVLSMLYSEALMLLLALGCLWALVARRWWVAGVAAGLATATRPNAVALVACCLFAAAPALRRRQWRALAAPVLAPTGVVAFLAFLWVRTGEASAWFDVQRGGWGESLGLEVWRRTVAVADDPIADINKLLATLGLVFCVAAFVVLLRSGLPSVLVVYTVVIVGLAVASQTLGLRPRFVLTAFPLFIALGLRLRGTAYAVVLGSSAALLGALTVLSTGTIVATP